MVFKTALVDELGLVQFWCDELDDEEISDLLEEFPEWSKKRFRFANLNRFLFRPPACDCCGRF